METKLFGFLPEARREGIITKEVEGELLVYDRTRDEAHCLNLTAAAVWKLCDGRSNVAEISRKLKSSVQSSKPEAQNQNRSNGTDVSSVHNMTPNGTSGIDDDLVWLALADLRRTHLLQEVPPSEGNGHLIFGMSRQEAVRRTGLG